MKKIILTCLSLFLCYSLNAMNFEAEKQTELFNIPLETVDVKIIGEIKNNNPHKELKVLSKNNQNLFNKEIYMLDNENGYSFFYDGKRCCFKIRLYEDKENYLFYVDNKNSPILIKISDKWISSLIIYNDRIYYSTEFNDDTIKSISLLTGETQVIEGYYPNVELNISENNNCIFEYEENYYRINNNVIEKFKNEKFRKKCDFFDFRLY